MLDKEISEIIGIDDPTVVKFIQSIKDSSNDLKYFKDKLDKLEVGFSADVVEKVYNILSRNETNSSNVTNIYDPEAQVVSILKSDVGIDDPVVGGFIFNILDESKTLGQFQEKINSLDAGLTSDTIIKIYKVVRKDEIYEQDNKSKKIDEQSVGLALPNQEIKWDDLNDTSDILSATPHRKHLDPAPVLYKIYKGKVRNIASFGCFVQIFGTQERKCEGLVHISQLSQDRTSDPHEVVTNGQLVFVKVIKLQPNGKISLSMKEVDQETGESLTSNVDDYGSNNALNEDDRGRSKISQNAKIKKRTLTSPERWEIRQLIASGAASIENYPELMEDTNINTAKTDGDITEINSLKREKDEEDTKESIDVELNTDDQPTFLKNEYQTEGKKYEMPKVSKVPKGSMNRVAAYGSNMMKEHREEKQLKKKEVEQKIRKMQKFDDPTEKSQGKRKEKNELRQQLVLTAWERNRMRESISYGKRTSLPISVQRQSLPVFKMKDEVLQAVRDNQFLVIVGETGSGKTTQITQYLNDAGFSDTGVIGCTQPRRVAAVSVATRVAQEFGCQLGEEVGYTIRFEDKSTPRTKIKYMTDGMLQREALLDPTMSKYSVIMLDEAHERTVATDVLFALLKQAAEKRPDLKVIVTSATLDSAKFSEYFLGCPIIKIPGKTFPVEVLYSQIPQMDYIEAALDSVMEIHINEGKGDILVFLTGQEEIDSCCEMLYSRVKELGDVICELVILPVYSALPSEVQSKIFEPTPEGSRKVVFATNIAETSITIDGIYYVIDPGFSKVNTFNPRIGMEQLVVKPISQAQANQRKGRAGRTGPGKCYRLYTESAFYNEMMANSIPEIQRQNLSHTILMLKAMGINDLLHFDFMDPPPKNLMVRALEELFNLEALDDSGYLTTLGKRMSQFPMEPTLSRSLIASVKNNCTEELITIIAMLSVQNVFFRPKEKQQEADQKKARFFHPYGDHLTLLNVYTRWQQASASEQFCTLNFLHFRHLKRAKDVKNQITMIFKKLGLPITKCHGDPDLVRKTLVTGFFMNAAKRDSQVGYKTITGNTIVGIHPSSSLYGKEYDYVMYHSLVMTNKEYMSQVSSIEPGWLVEFAPHFYKTIDSDSASRKKAKIAPLYNKFSKDQNSWRLSSIRQNREKALGIKR